MAQHLDIGNKGEALAKEYLLKKGYQVLEENWRFSRAEVDLIAMDGQALVFIEVKTRSTDFFGAPELAVDHKKQNLLSDAANVYMQQINHEWEIRFDIIAIVLGDEDPKIEHFKDAFFSGWH